MHVSTDPRHRSGLLRPRPSMKLVIAGIDLSARLTVNGIASR